MRRPKIRKLGRLGILTGHAQAFALSEGTRSLPYLESGKDPMDSVRQYPVCRPYFGIFEKTVWVTLE
jgi:hypothetical protein